EPDVAAETTRPRILFVDADADARRLAEEVGARSLYDVTTVSDAAIASALATNERWDAVMVDGSLGPDEDPFELARAIRGEPRHGQVPLAVMSTSSSMDVRVAAAHA